MSPTKLEQNLGKVGVGKMPTSKPCPCNATDEPPFLSLGSLLRSANVARLDHREGIGILNSILAWVGHIFRLRKSKSEYLHSMPDVCHLTKKAEPPPTRDVNRDSGTDSANGGWLWRLVRRNANNHAIWLSGSFLYARSLSAASNLT